ncbi:hypothetical protein EMGBD4_04120 [Verrucomicrobiota bacterium]|nr:hypothetical protein EMGBD4_04120 [Verrucomicrobiota bacterium]
MSGFLDQLLAALASMGDVRQMIEIGGIAVMTVIVFAETGLLFGFFLPGDSMIVVAGILTTANTMATSPAPPCSTLGASR